MDDKNVAHYPADVEMCESKTQTFYNVVGDNIVYVTITVQKLPSKVMGKTSEKGFQTVKDFVSHTTEILDYLDIGQLIT